MNDLQLISSPAANSLNRWKQEHRDFRRKLDGTLPEWMKEFHQEGWTAFIQKGLPQKGWEDWRFTSLLPFWQNSYSLAEEATKASISSMALTKLELPRPNSSDEIRLFFVNGVFNPHLSQLPSTKDSPLFVCPLHEMIQNKQDGPMLSPLLRRLSQMLGQEVFFQLNKAFWHQGIVLRLQAGHSWEHHIHIIHLTHGSTPSTGGMLHPGHFVVLEEGSKATLVETYLHVDELDGSSSPPSTPSSMFINSCTGIFLGQNSSLEHLKVQLNSPHHLHLSHLGAELQQGANYHNFLFNLGAKLARHTLKVELQGRDAQTHLDGLYALQDGQQCDYYSLIDHQAPRTNGFQLYKGILSQKSHGVFRGRIFVQKEAQQTQSRQLNKNLLLSNLAHVHTMPQLEIGADDVQCTHGATVGQLREEEIFYLQSRGLSEKRARDLLAHAFANDIILKIPHANWRKWLEEILFKHFEQFIEF